MARISQTKKTKSLVKIAVDSKAIKKALKSSPFQISKSKWREIVSDNFDKTSEIVLQGAKDRCPSDYGNLEEAIVVKKRRYIDYKHQAVIEVLDLPIPDNENGSFWRTDEDGRRKEYSTWKVRSKPRSTHDYSYFVNELVTPAGPKQLGPVSQEKQAEVDVVVGGKFIERALEENKEEIEQMMYDILAAHLES